jgi:hypothetical protein
MKNKLSGISNIKTREDFPEIGIERDHFVGRLCALGAYMQPFSTQVHWDL